MSLYTSFAGNINFVVTGGTFRTADNNTDPYAVTTTSSGALSATPGDPTNIPSGSTIVAAYLYYAASGNTVDANVTFNGTAITADRTFTDTTVEPFYSGFKDVTSIVSSLANPNTTYTLTDLNISTGNPWNTNQTVLGGWALVVIYSNNTTETNRVINVFDGFQAFQNSNITLNPSNFQIPNSGINGKFAVITWEGDPTLSGNETLQFNGTTLTDACNGTNNQYNSTINTLTCTGIAATDDVYYGVDIDAFDVSSYLTAGATTVPTFYQSGQDAVMLSAQIISVSNTPVADLSITKSHSGNFDAGSNGTYTLTVHNNGPASATGTTTVTDTLPSGLGYVSATGTGWTCGFASGTVTCTTTSSIASGADANAITLTVSTTASSPSSVSNTASVSNDTLFDNVSSNNSSTDATTINHPDLSTSTKTVADKNGGDANPGDVLEYTITVKESGGLSVSSASVTDDIPADVTGFTVVSTPSGSTDSSTGTGGANGTGYLDITNISVPANGSVTIVFDVTIATGTAAGTNIDNTATVTNPDGTGATPAAPTVVVSQSGVPASGNKILYLYDSTTPSMDLELTRTPQPSNTTTQDTVAENGTQDWTQSPVFQKAFTLSAGTVSVSLVTARSGSGFPNNARSVYVELLKNGTTSLGTSATQNFNSATPTLRTFNITVAQTSFTATDYLVLRVHNTSSGGGTRTVDVYQKDATAGSSTLTLSTTTVINVDSVNVYSAAYSATSTQSVYEPNATNVYIRAVVSDPFGSYDIAASPLCSAPATAPCGTAPLLTITDANGSTQLTATEMTQVDSTASTKTFEYQYTIPDSGVEGYWTPSVKAWEGTEQSVSHTANGTFRVGRANPIVLKSVSVLTDPVNCTDVKNSATCSGAKLRALPTSYMLYTINVSNDGLGRANHIVINDAIPTNSSFVVGSIVFADGSTSSGLTAPTYLYSTTGCTDADFVGYAPTADANGVDTAVKCIRIPWTDSDYMNGKTGATAPSFTVTFKVQVN